MANLKKILTTFLIVGFIIGCIFLVRGCYKHTYIDSNTVEYTLYEINDGVYGYYNTVSSKAPAHNYESITLCVNGNIHTFTGSVNIHYTNGDRKLVWTDKNYVNGDIFDVYVPYGSIEVRPNVGLG
jgi:hypothetical protein